MTRRMMFMAVAGVLAFGGCGDTEPAPPPAQPAPAVHLDARADQLIDCPPVSPAPCVMRPVPGDPSRWTIHDATGRQIGVVGS